MNTQNLLFLLLVTLAITSASFNKNLRYLDDQNEREMDDSGSPEVNEGSSDPTTPETTTSTPEVTTTSSSESTTTTTVPDAESTTTTQAPDPETITTSSTSSSDEPLPEDRFICSAGSAGLANNKGYKLKEFKCLLPKPDDVEGNPAFSVKNGETDVKCTATPLASQSGIYKVTIPSEIEVLSNHLTVTSNWSDVINTTELYLGCRLGNSYYASGEEVTGDNNKCPEPLNTEIYFNGTCKHYDSYNVMGTDKEYEFIFNEKSDVCECTSSITVKGSTVQLTTENLNFGNKTNLPCKGPGEETEVICSVSGWVTLTSDEISSCTLEDAASTTVISNLVFGFIVLISLTIL